MKIFFQTHLPENLWCKKFPFAFNYSQMFDGLKTELILEKPIFNSIWTNFDLFLRQVYLMKSIRAFAKNQKFFFVLLPLHKTVVQNCDFREEKAQLTGNAHLISHDPRSMWGLQRLVIILSGTISNIDSFIKYFRGTGFLHGLLVA